MSIGSFGFKPVIKIIMELAGRFDDVQGILTPSDFAPDNTDGVEMTNGKNDMLESIRNGHSKSKILLIDDSDENIDLANKAGFITYHVKGKAGITKKDVKGIKELFKKNEILGILLDADLTLFRIHVTSEKIYRILEEFFKIEDDSTSDDIQSFLVKNSAKYCASKNDAVKLFAEGSFELLDFISKKPVEAKKRKAKRRAKGSPQRSHAQKRRRPPA